MQSTVQIITMLWGKSQPTVKNPRELRRSGPINDSDRTHLVFSEAIMFMLVCWGLKGTNLVSELLICKQKWMQGKYANWVFPDPKTLLIFRGQKCSLIRGWRWVDQPVHHPSGTLIEAALNCQVFPVHCSSLLSWILPGSCSELADCTLGSR